MGLRRGWICVGPRWRRTANTYYSNNPKFVYYLSAEYLLGRQLTQNMLYTDTWDLACQVLAEEAPQCRVGALSGPNLAKEIGARQLARWW